MARRIAAKRAGQKQTNTRTQTTGLQNAAYDKIEVVVLAYRESAMTASSTNTYDDLLRNLANSQQKDNRVELYKFHNERTEEIRTRLWTALTWLAGVQGAILALQQQQFVEGVNIKGSLPSFMLAVGLAVVGFVLAFYMILIVEDGTKHIESNWHSSDVVLHSSDVVLGKADPREKTPFLKTPFLKRCVTFPAFGLMAALGIVLCFAHLLAVLLAVYFRYS
jgi:hypothetical protein